MIRRQDYERIGGHAAVAAEVIEDVALARIAKQSGIRLNFASGQGIMRVRMYRTFGAMWEGWTKNLYPLMCRTAGGRTISASRELFGVIPWIPFLLLLFTAAHPIVGAVGLGLLAGRHAEYAAKLRRNRFPRGPCSILLASRCAVCGGAFDI